MISLRNKVAVITGGSRGIGAATAKLLARAGADIVINYLENEKEACSVANEIQSTGQRVVLHRGNVGERNTAKNLISLALQRFDRLDILVNNAGIWTHGAIGQMSEDVWDQTMEVNLRSLFNVTDAAIPALKKSASGRIINISSTAGQRGESFHAHYAASKGGVLAFTKSIAVELAPHRILVNSVAPGWVDTDMNAEVFADSEFKNRAIEGIPLRKIATAEDVAGSVLFLASDFASHITGSTINVNGGSVLI